MVKVILIVLCIVIVPGVVMGVISSYRAGQKPHRDLYQQLQIFLHREK